MNSLATWNSPLCHLVCVCVCVCVATPPRFVQGTHTMATHFPQTWNTQPFKKRLHAFTGPFQYICHSIKMHTHRIAREASRGNIYAFFFFNSKLCFRFTQYAGERTAFKKNKLIFSHFYILSSLSCGDAGTDRACSVEPSPCSRPPGVHRIMSSNLVSKDFFFYWIKGVL